MIYCTNCGLANRDGSRFCNECGMRLGLRVPCPACGESNLSTSRFCNFCGTRTSFDTPAVPASADAPRADNVEPASIAAESALAPGAESDVTPSASPEAGALTGETVKEIDDSLPYSEDVADEFESIVSTINDLEPEYKEQEIEAQAPVGSLVLDAADAEEELVGGRSEAAAASLAALGQLEDTPPEDSVAVITVERDEFPSEGAGLLEELLKSDTAIPVEPRVNGWATKNSPLDLVAYSDEVHQAEADAEDYLPSWLVESDEPPADPAPAVAEEEVAFEQHAVEERTEEGQPAQTFPWERPEGIALARSIAAGVPHVRFEEQSEPMPNANTVYLKATSSPWQTFSASSPAKESRRPARRKGGTLRLVLVGLLVAALILLGAVVSNQMGIQVEIAPILDQIGAVFSGFGTIFYGN